MQLGEFIVANWTLFLALVSILAALAWTYYGPSAVKGVGAAEAIRLMNHSDAVVVDVRTDKEYQEGHIMSSLHIPLGVIENRVSELQGYKNTPLVMVCRTGARSGQAATKLKKLGFEQVYNISGGMLAWQSANLPTTTEKTKRNKLAKASRHKAPKQTGADDSHAEEHPQKEQQKDEKKESTV